MPTEIPLSQGLFAIIDDADTHLVADRKWHATRCGTKIYARAHGPKVNGRWTKVFMHRLLLGDVAGNLVDHKDRNGLNNQRSNLRPGSKILNGVNSDTNATSKTSKFRGVGWHKRGQTWRAYLKIKGRALHLGSFKTEEDAARSYDKKALELWGDFAVLNFANKL